MNIQIRQIGLKLTSIQRSKLESQLRLALARFAERLGRVIVRFSDAASIPGYKRCQIEIGGKAELVSVEHSDINVFVALEHAAARAARSVGRAIEKQSWSDRRS